MGRIIGWEDRGGEIEQVNEVMIPIGNFGSSESRTASDKENEIDWSALHGVDHSHFANERPDLGTIELSTEPRSGSMHDQSTDQTNCQFNNHPMSMQMAESLDQMTDSTVQVAQSLDQMTDYTVQCNHSTVQSTQSLDQSMHSNPPQSISPSGSTHSSQLASRAAIYGAISKILSQNLAQSKSLSRTQFDTIHRLFLNCCPSTACTLEEVPVDAAVFDLCKIPFVSKAIRKAHHGSGAGRKEAERALRRILAKELCKSLQQQSKEAEKECAFDLANYKQAPGRSTYSAKFLDYERELKTIEEFKKELATAPIKIPDFALGKQSVIFQVAKDSGEQQEKVPTGGVEGSSESKRFPVEPKQLKDEGFSFDSKPTGGFSFKQSDNSGQAKGFSFDSKPTGGFSIEQADDSGESKGFSFDSKPTVIETRASGSQQSDNSGQAKGFSFDSKPLTDQPSTFTFQSQSAVTESKPTEGFSSESKPTERFSFDPKPAQTSFSSGSKPAQAPFSFESKPAQSSFSFDPKPAQSSFSSESKPAQSSFSFDSKPAQSSFSFESKPAQSSFSFDSTPTEQKPTAQNQFPPAPEPKTIPPDTKSPFSFQQQSPSFTFQNPQPSSTTVQQPTEKKSPFQAQNFNFTSQQQLPQQGNAFQAQPAFSFPSSQNAFQKPPQPPNTFSFNQQQPASEQQRPPLAFSFPSAAPAPTQQPNPFGANAGTFNLFQAPSAAPQTLFNPPAKLDFSQQPVFSFTSNSSVTSPKSAGANTSAFPTSFVNRRRK